MDQFSTPPPSLIVKLQYKHLCDKCTDVLSRWCSPPSGESYGGRGYGLSQNYVDLVRGLECNPDYQRWTWTIHALQTTSSWCRCCSFLLDAINANTCQPYSGDDFLHISTQPVGSQHITATEGGSAQPKTWLYSLINGNVQTTEHITYYRPSLRLYRPQNRTQSLDTPGRFDSYVSEHLTFILPAADQSDTTNEESGNSGGFLGRQIEANVDMSLVRSWLYKCASTHDKRPTSHGTGLFPLNRSPSAADCDGCQPNICSIKDFRLVSVAKRCIVRMNEPVRYAALSYVWGKATRFLLRKDNVRLLSTPGALCAEKNQMPQTFQDAFDIAQSLSIPYVWIDALCICQDDADQLMEHMEQMEDVYGGAVLTVVSDTESADTGIPGISIPRRALQASFTWAGTTYLSTRKTFGQALKDSPWEKRAWCLQEKIFSKRLLIFAEAQAFYHCAAATWFEDTVLEERQNVSGPVHIREKARIARKGSDESPYSATYEAHREYFGRNLWSLVSIYSKREISFKSDTLLAFAGVLKSVEDAFGSAIWGIPAFEFARGLTWTQSTHCLSVRQHGFPSWSWAGWRFNTDTSLVFRACKRSDRDLRVLDGRYRVSTGKLARHSAWDMDWYYHAHIPGTKAFSLSPIPSKHHTTSSFKVGISNAWSLAEPFKDLLLRTEDVLQSGLTFYRPKSRKSWEQREEHDATSPLAYAVPCEQCKTSPSAPLKPPNAPHMIPPLTYNPMAMPPQSHILRFYTSTATVLIDSESKHSEFYLGQDVRPYYGTHAHRVLLPGTEEHIGFVELDPEWSGIGGLHDLIYISRWCPNFAGYEDDQVRHPETLNLLLVESVEGWGEVRRRVQLVQPVELRNWRKAELRWEVVSLA